MFDERFQNVSVKPNTDIAALADVIPTILAEPEASVRATTTDPLSEGVGGYGGVPTGDVSKAQGTVGATMLASGFVISPTCNSGRTTGSRLLKLRIPFLVDLAILSNIELTLEYRCYFLP
jgi:hypothetical protein